MPDQEDPLAWERLHSTIAYTCPGFEIRHDDVRLPDGTETDFDYLTEVESVVVLPFTPDGEVVVIEEWRQAVDRINRGLPAGGLEPDDDDLAVAARRELTEETGYVADRVERLTSVEPVNGIANSVHHYFVAHDCEPSGEQDLDFNETIRAETMAYEALVDAVENDRVRDGRTVTAVCYFELFGR